MQILQVKLDFGRVSLGISANELITQQTNKPNEQNINSLHV